MNFIRIALIVIASSIACFLYGYNGGTAKREKGADEMKLGVLKAWEEWNDGQVP